jgi:adenosylcobyric acid synthase
VIIQGHAIGHLSALDYHAYKQQAYHAVMQSWQRLTQQYQAVMVEGAGSPAEINLRANDIANMGFAEAADCPVWLVADIDKGGVFAHFVGTLSCLSPSEQDRITGFIINRFRGDIALLQDGLDWLEAKTGKPVLAVVPYLHGLDIAAEDAISTVAFLPKSGTHFRIVAPVFPHISNHTDLDALRQLPDIEVCWVLPQQPIPPADLIVLCGSKNTLADLTWLIKQGWADAIAKHLRYGGKVIGICGGYQMLGQLIIDPDGIESRAGAMQGLGYLPIHTTLYPHKQLHQVTGILTLAGQSVTCTGYEIHQGLSQQLDLTQPSLITLDDGRVDGVISADQQVLGTYLHGIFDHPHALKCLLEWAGYQLDQMPPDPTAVLEQQIDRLADAVDQAMNWQKARAAGWDWK